MDLEAVNRTLAATVRKQEDELKAADAEIARLKEGVAVTGRLFAASRDALAEVSADNERLRAALEACACNCSSNCEWESGEVCPSWVALTARAALTAQPAAPVSPWQPIETAPKDGTLIVALTPAPQFVRWWTDLDGYGEDYPWVGRDGCSYKVSQVTHWMPLPAAPGGE